MLRPLNTPIESFEPEVRKAPPELLVQINKKGEAAEEAEGLRMVLDVMLKVVGALHRAGVPIVAGTDVGVPGHTNALPQFCAIKQSFLRHDPPNFTDIADVVEWIRCSALRQECNVYSARAN